MLIPSCFYPITSYPSPSEEFNHSSSVMFTSSPAEALKDADVVVTDTWISMGQEEEAAKRMKDFEGFQVTEGSSRPISFLCSGVSILTLQGLSSQRRLPLRSLSTYL
jgi:hypothetical protein